ncbi:MAG: hypothetical protein ACK5KT_08315 [Dysgonomonas sp.]
MKIFKTIVGSIIGIASIVTLTQMIGEEQGGGLIGVFMGFLILGGLSGWLIYSGIKK